MTSNIVRLNNIKPPSGSNKNKKRIGRGQGSGSGTQAGKGHKGQKARKSGNVRIGFEGGNMPLYMRVPKSRVFSNKPFKSDSKSIHVRELESCFKDGESVTMDSLRTVGLLSAQSKVIKIKVFGLKTTEKKLKFSEEIKLSKNLKN